ncbi:MAG: response regulator [Gemmatimonadota bacterium]
MKRKASIRAWLVVMVLAITVPLAGLGAYVVWSEARFSRQLADVQVAQTAEATAEAIGQFLRDAEQSLQGMVRRPSIRTLDPASCQGYLEEANAVLLQYTNLFLVRRNGDLVCSALAPGDRSSGADASWFAEAVATDGFNASKPQYGRISERRISVFSQPVEDTAGAVVGYLGMSVDVERFRELLAAAIDESGGIATLAHIDGTVVARSDDPSWVGRHLPRVEGGARHAEQVRGIQRAVGLDGIDRVWGFRTVPNSDWIVYAGVPTAAVYAGWRSEAIGTTVAILLLVALLSLLAGGLYGKIAGALARLLEGVEAAADRGATSVPTSGPAEVVSLAQAFNRTLAARANAEEGLRRSTERYQSILRNAVFGIYVSTPEGRLLEANPALADMLGYKDERDLLTLPMERFYADPSERDRLVRLALDGRGSNVVDVEWVRADGSPLHARLYVSRTQDPEGESAFEVLVEDRTERRELEEQLRQSQKLEAIGTLAGGVAHDFNNRLTVIQGQAGILLAELDEEDPLRESAEAILESARRGAELTAQLLAFGRRQVSRPSLIDLNEVIREMRGILARLMGESVEIEVRFDPGRVPVMADRGQIEQILLNLATNARDAMPDGGHLTISTETVPVHSETRTPLDLEAGTYAVLAVADDGKGMDEGVRARLFEPFFTTKGEGEGTGLGLSTVYGMVKQARGDLEVESAPGRGARFRIWLPLGRGTLPDRDDGPSRDAPEPRRPTRVLVAEDEPGVRRIVVRSLTRAGYQVAEAGSGEEALALVAGGAPPPELLVTDVVMPGMHGGELADRLLERLPALHVLFISGYSDEAPIDLVRRSPVRDFLAKPFTPDELLHRVAALLQVERVG